MGDPDGGVRPDAENWDTFWRGAEEKSAFTSGGTGHPAVFAFWDELFANANARFEAPRLVDIAGGNGAVIERAALSIAPQSARFTCIDISTSAVKMLRQRFPYASGIVADARRVPLQSSTYDIVTSQFGIEYAGLDAIDEMLRLVADGGQLALLLHHRHGGIYGQSEASLVAMQQLQRSRFIPLSIATFDAGFKAIRGADRGPYEAAAKDLVPAIRLVETIMKQHGTSVADGTIQALYRDISVVHKRMPHYEPAEVLGWLERTQVEVGAYAGRMSSMLRSAIDAPTFEQLCQRVKADKFDLVRQDALMNPERSAPLAWALVAERR